MARGIDARGLVDVLVLRGEHKEMTRSGGINKKITANAETVRFMQSQETI